jgi:hypothetical protein
MYEQITMTYVDYIKSLNDVSDQPQHGTHRVDVMGFKRIKTFSIRNHFIHVRDHVDDVGRGGYVQNLHNRVVQRYIRGKQI